MDLKNEEGFTAAMVKVSTKQLIRGGAGWLKIPVYELIQEAVDEYLTRRKYPDLRHVAADSDRIGERDV